jgi:hypothetical protein
MVRTFTPGRVRVCAFSGARDGAGTAQGRLSYAVRGRPQAKFGSKGADKAVSNRWKVVSLKAISSSPPYRARSLRASAHLQLVSLRYEEILIEQDMPIEHVYFPLEMTGV